MSELEAIQERLQAIRLIAMDVDGVLTDGSIVLSEEGEESKQFNIQDGLGIRLALSAGLIVAWISGRSAAVVRRRASELGIMKLFENTANKSAAIAELLGTYTLTQANFAYIGDDLNDIPAYSLARGKFAPA